MLVKIRSGAPYIVQVSSRIRADLLQRAGEFNIKLEDVSITHLTFGKVRDILLLLDCGDLQLLYRNSLRFRIRQQELNCFTLINFYRLLRQSK